MRIGIDLDNTIIRYDELFARLAIERQLVPPHVALNKQAIRDYLRSQNQEDRWTELQGIAYGSRIEEAVPFVGAWEFFQRCESSNMDWRIISHRTRIPILGDSVDLHAAAQQWLLKREFVSSDQLDRVLIETAREEKLARIVLEKCDWFIDDLPELLSDRAFPREVRRILFDPADQNCDRPEYDRVTSWREIARLVGLDI